MSELEEFKAWADEFSVWDDGFAAFRALKQIEKARFILATRGMEEPDGWVEELEQALA